MKYRVLKIEKCAITSFLDLQNMESGTEEKNCFDDSRAFGYKDFSFMEEGGVYDCKLALLGEFVDKADQFTKQVRILERNIAVGTWLFLKASIGRDIYYIPEADANNLDIQPVMQYSFTRKDLIQVDDVIHPDCLSK